MNRHPPALTANTALFLDFDGTLVGFASRPEGVTLPRQSAETVERVYHKLDGALAIVTGREIISIAGQFAPFVMPVAGSHGAERRRADGGVETPGPETAFAASDIAAALTAELGDIPGIFIEHKVFSVALHYRNAPDFADRITASARAILSGRDDWEGIQGKMVVEIRPSAYSKGSAVCAFMAEPPFTGRVPVFVGDDRTDEDGIVAAMRLGGFGIKVGTAETVARYGLESPEAVHAWLSAFAG